MFVRLKLYFIEFLKVELPHLDNVIGSQITPACIHLRWTRTGLSNLSMINSLCSVCDPELEQLKLVKGSQEGNKKTISMRGSVHSNMYQKQSTEMKCTAL